MWTLEDEIRSLLADQAQAAPGGVELLTAVKARSRHRLIVRRTGAAGLTALAVGVSVSAVPVVLHGSERHAPPFGGSTATPTSTPPSSTPPSSTPPSSTLGLEPVTVQPTVTFPYSPTFVPAGFPTATVIRTSADFLMHNRQLDDSKLIRVGTGTKKPTLADGAPDLAGAKLQPVTVRGHAGSIASGGDHNSVRFLFWQEKPGTWLSIYSRGVSSADLLRYAQGLRERTLKNTEAFHYALLPPGLVIHESLHYNATFAPAGAPPDAEPIGGLVVMLNDSSTPTGIQVRVGTHTGYLSTDNGGRELRVDLGNHNTLTVGFAGLSDDDLIRFAAGVTVDLSSI